MDRRLMNASCISPVYENEVEQFLEFALEKTQPNEEEKYLCPCINCLNERKEVVDDIREHILYDEIQKNYTTWI